MASEPAKPVLMVMTSHDKLGDTGKPTGFFLGELTHPLEVFEKAGVPVEFSSIKGGEPPVDGLELDDPVNARYWNDKDFRAKLAATKKLSEVDAADYSAVFFVGGHGCLPSALRARRQARHAVAARLARRAAFSRSKSASAW